MRIKYFLILLFSTLSNFASAQQIEIGSFGITGGTWNANNTLLLVKRDANTTFQTNLLVIRSTSHNIISRPIKLEARVIFINKLDEDWTIVSPVVNFTTTDFIGPSGASEVKTVSTTVPKDFLSSYGDGELVVQWRYYKDEYPAPDQVNGWTKWHQTKQKINCGLEPIVIPPTTISGPTSICSEATYTITNPGTITLENATGIATITQLGNNQWKVTRIGEANGNVFLQSVIQSKTYKNEITVGLAQPEINGPNDAIYNQEFIVTCPINPSHSINWTTAGLPEGSIVTNISEGVIKIKLPIKNASHPNTGYFSIYGTVTGCGSLMMATKHINYTSNGAPGPGDDGGPEL